MEKRAEILSGQPIAEAIKNEVAAEIRALAEQGIVPCLVVVRVGEDAASAVYVGNKVKTSKELGIISEHFHLPETVSQTELLQIVSELNERADIDGILVQLPLPKHLNEKEILEAIVPEKDVDGFHPINVGRLASGQDSLTPCTPAGVIELLVRNNIEIRGTHAVVVGRSNIVGKPMAQMLLAKDATVTICHSRTKNLAEITSQADILVAAVGITGIIRAEHIKRGAIVIDVGMNKITTQDEAIEFFDATELEKRLAAIEKRGFTLVGDVNQKDAMQKAAKFTPVPGGVGLLTIAMLMQNTIKACKMRRFLKS